MIHVIRSLACLRATCLALTLWGAALAGCDDVLVEPPLPRGTLSGRVADLPGNQAVAPWVAAAPRGLDWLAGAVQADEAVLMRVDLGQREERLAVATVSASGLFAFERIPLWRGPLIVQLRARGAVVGEVIVPGGLRMGAESVIAAPVSLETTVEAQAFRALIAAGVRPVEIDVVDLMARITAPMAIGADGAALAMPVWEAQQAYLAALDALTPGPVNARAAQEAKLPAWRGLAIELAVAQGAPELAVAWDAFEDQVPAAIALGLDAEPEAHGVASAMALEAMAARGSQ